MTHGVMRLFVLAIVLSWGTVVAGPIDRLVVISDSLSDTGNLTILTTPTGMPVPQSPPYAPGRFSNGPIWTDGVADAFGLTVNNAILGPLGDGFVDNFAVAGSFTGSYTLPPPVGSGETVSNVFDFYSVLGGGVPFGVPGAAEQFGAYASSGIDRTATHVLWAGSNDLLYSPFLDPQALTNPNALVAFAQNAATNVVNIALGVAAAGVTDLIVLNLPDLGATPFADFNTPSSPVGQLLQGIFPSAAALSAYLSGATQLFNAELASQLATAGIDVTQFDLAASFQDVLNNPQNYGITNVNDPCLQALVPAVVQCADPDEYVFWDDVHPTRAVHQVLARQLAAEINVPQPLLLLALGLGVAVLQRARCMS